MGSLILRRLWRLYEDQGTGPEHTSTLNIVRILGGLHQFRPNLGQIEKSRRYVRTGVDGIWKGFGTWVYINSDDRASSRASTSWSRQIDKGWRSADAGIRWIWKGFGTWAQPNCSSTKRYDQSQEYSDNQDATRHPIMSSHTSSWSCAARFPSKTGF